MLTQIFVNWDTVLTSIIGAVVGGGMGWLLSFVAFRSKVTQQIEEIYNTLKSMKKEHDDDISSCHKRISDKDGEVKDLLQKHVMANTEAQRKISDSLAEVAKGMNELMGEVRYMSGKLDNHIENGKK